MDSSDLHTNPNTAIPFGYALGRYLARFFHDSASGKARLLGDDLGGLWGPVLLVVHGAPRFSHISALALTMDRPVRFLVPEDVCQGFWARRTAGQLGVIGYGADSSSRSSAFLDARDALSFGDAVAVFAEMEPARSELLSSSCFSAAKLALEADTRIMAGAGVQMVPIHVLSAYGPTPAGETLVTAGSPLVVRDFRGGANSEASLRTLAGALEEKLSQNPCRLEERDVRFLLADFEQILRADLEEDWASRPNWKQKTEGFEISRFAVEFVEDLNTRDPAELAGLRIDLERYREELRRSALIRAGIEVAGEWLQSSASRARYWVEAIVSAPIAFYGFVNHLIPIAVFLPGNLFQRLARKDPGQAWLLRALVVLGSYVLQVSLCAKWWGRAAAGYYTLTLPVSGLILWRFMKMVRSRVRLLFQARSLPRRQERVRQLRKQLIERFNRARDEYAEASLVPR